MGENNHSTLLNISESLGGHDLTALKFIFQDFIHRTNITEGINLFTLLSGKQLIGLLKHALCVIGRKDLASKLEDSTSTKRFSPFRILLFDIAEDLRLKDLSSAKYLFDKIPKRKSDEITNFFEFFSVLEELEIYSETNTHRLQDCLKQLHRNDLVSKLKLFQDDRDAQSRHVKRKACSPNKETYKTNAKISKLVTATVTPRMTKAPFRQAQDTVTSRTYTDEMEATKDIDTDAAQPKPPSGKMLAMFEGALGKRYPDKDYLINDKLLVDAGLSVGLIGRNGTGFMVGGGCVITAAHVFKEALEIPDEIMQKCQHGLLDYSKYVDERLRLFGLWITFTFGSKRQNFRLFRVRFMAAHIDTSVIELEKNDCAFPPSFANFLDVSDEGFFFELLGHDNADLEISRDRKCYTIVNKEHFQSMKSHLLGLNIDERYLSPYDGFGENESYVEFHCSMKNGASGSPGVVVRNGEVHVFTMLRAGYPELPHNEIVSEELCVEQGVRMRAIRNCLYGVDPGLCYQIFSSW